jgi:Adenylate and Guanylate cyclase catalytic domain
LEHLSGNGDFGHLEGDESPGVLWLPAAHEDDAERSVRAGLELSPLQTRVGIATGVVVVGDLIGSGASQEQAIVGETPNLAARLQAIAEPNSVLRRVHGSPEATCLSLRTLGRRTSKVLRPDAMKCRE